MDGKRKSYVNPVKLYIFISFLAFFIPAILPYPIKSKDKIQIEDISVTKEYRLEFDIPAYGTVTSLSQLDSIHISKPKEERINATAYKIYKDIFQHKQSPDSTGLFIDEIVLDKYGHIRSVTQLDSIYNSAPEGKRMNEVEYYIVRNIFKKKKDPELIDRYTRDLLLFTNNYQNINYLAELDSLHKSLDKKERLTKKHYDEFRTLLIKKENPDYVDIDFDDDLVDTKDLIGSSVDFFVNTMVEAFENFESQEIPGYGKISSSYQLDSLHNLKTSDERMAFEKYMLYKSVFNIRDNTMDKHKQEKMIEFDT